VPKAVTIRDVARKAGVGVGTVSRVLNNNPSVSQATREKVLEIIESLHYRPSPIARQLSTGAKSLAIGIIVPFFTRPAFVGRLEGIEATLAQSRYNLVLYNVETPKQRDKLLRRVPDEHLVDGLIIVSLYPTEKEVRHFEQSSMPVVLVDASHPDLPHISIDDFDGGRQATQHLIDLGHRQIGFVSDQIESPFGFNASRKRLEGYQAVLEKNGIGFEPTYHKAGELSRHSASQLTHQLLTDQNQPTAIFTSSDTQAIGVLEAIQEEGLRVPEDISVIGYDDIEVASYIGLTTVHQPMYQSGVESVNLLFKLLSSDNNLESLTLPVDLVVRETTGQAPN
jgi:DNA-binding LacI/PurR family transcriptional regulator